MKSIVKALLAGATIACSTGVAAQTRTEQTVLMSEHPGVRQFQEQYGFSDAVIVGDLVFLSGVVVGVRPGDTDLVGAYERTYRGIGNALKRAGASYDDIVDITSYHTDVKAQIDIMAAVQKKHLKAPYPAWTTIDVDRLLPDEGITEIKIIARKPAVKPQ